MTSNGVQRECFPAYRQQQHWDFNNKLEQTSNVQLIRNRLFNEKLVQPSNKRGLKDKMFKVTRKV